MAKPKRSLKSEENMPLRPKYEGRNDNGAFQIWQVPNKLRGKPSGINQKPNIPNVGGSRAQRPAQQPQLDPENLRELVKQKRKVSEARSTPTTSTSTTTATSSTTSTVPTTSTIQTETSSMSTSNKAHVS